MESILAFLEEDTVDLDKQFHASFEVEVVVLGEECGLHVRIGLSEVGSIDFGVNEVLHLVE